MDPDCHKHYHVHEYNPKALLTTYFSPDLDKTLYEHITLFPIRTLLKLVSSGKISGTTLIDYSAGPFICHLVPICKYFKEIILLEENDCSIKETENWWHGKEEAFDWSHISDCFTGLEADSENWIEKEESLKCKIRYILKCDLSKENPTDPVVLPKADCLMSFFCIQNISKDKKSFCENMRKFSTFLNVGGHLLMLGAFNEKFFTIGEHRFYTLSYDEVFLRETVEDTGFTIEHVEILDSRVANDITEYDQLYLISAIKVKEV
ncbi:nicotinamide N-methyltransferase-like [Bufo bufo]|uniref:nicotinamide N-methyltransferase-like n=1 Tax=Bufo bufo TaxID=8384 RepID=UPI001ABE8FE3|nr:nicotinamide N-methyltransferase-like [Bufo bufo]